MDSQHKATGRLLKAPENFLDAAGVRQVASEARQGRRNFIRNAFAAAGAAVAAPVALATGNPVPPADGDANILELPEHSRGLLIHDPIQEPLPVPAEVTLALIHCSPAGSGRPASPWCSRSCPSGASRGPALVGRWVVR